MSDMGDLSHLVDLASERIGGRAIHANDEFFAAKENLLKPGRGVFLADEYTDLGKWMDGWETRRRREPGHDWCVVRLGAPGVIHAVDVDTNHFRGNHPEACSVDACSAEVDDSPEGVQALEDRWVEIVPKAKLEGHSSNVFAVRDPGRYSHVRLNIYPDGGVARFRVHGVVEPDWDALAASDDPIDLVSVLHGGVPLGSSDSFFSEPGNLLVPERSTYMGDGWETRRRRGPGHDWVVLRLGHRGVVERIEVDTNHFKGNYPESCSIDACDVPYDPTTPRAEHADLDELPWTEILPRTKLQAHTRHFFEDELLAPGPFTLLRLNIHPDGGVSRLRVIGRPTSGEHDVHSG